MTAALIIALIIALGAAVTMGYRWSRAVAQRNTVKSILETQKRVIKYLGESVDAEAKLKEKLKKIDETDDPSELTDLYNDIFGMHR